MDEEVWYFLDGETPTGPLPWAGLLGLQADGLIGPTTAVRRDVDAHWIALSEALALSRGEGLPPPLPTARDSGPPEPNRGPPAAAEALTIGGWSSRPVAPWRRYAARTLDTVLQGGMGFFLLALIWYAVAPVSAARAFAVFDGLGGRILDFVASSFLAAIIGGIVMGSTGWTFGKLLFGVRVLTVQAAPPGIGSALRRELDIWVRGMAFGLPVVSLITCFLAYGRVKADGGALWDKGRFVVLHRPASTRQSLLNAVGVAVIITVFALLKKLSAS